MKNFVLFMILHLHLSLFALEPVKYTDIQKFSGLWYEIARTYNSYQEKCVGSSVEYQLQEDSHYDVYNRCFDTVIGGELIEYSGTAKPSKGKNIASLDMTYFWIFTKKYNVYYLESAYSYAVVGDDDFEQVWIMSRKPTMPREVQKQIIALLETHMDTNRFIYTPQDNEGRYK